MRVVYIEQAQALKECCIALKKSKVLALDTEFESRRSGTTLAIIQISDGQTCFVIDVLALESLTDFSSVITAPDITWIVHAGRQDLDLVSQISGGQRPKQVFDTQVAWGLVSPEYQVGLAYLVAQVCGQRLSKNHQNDQWLERPLSAEQIHYAADDVRYLHEIYHQLSEKLAHLEKNKFIFEACDENLKPAIRRSQPITLSSYRNLWQLDGQQRQALRFLIKWYSTQDVTTRKKLVHHKVLFDIAAALPTDVESLAAMKSVPARFAHGVGKTLIPGYLEAANSAKAAVGESLPVPYERYESLFLEAWLHCARIDICHRAQICVELGFPQWLQKELAARADANEDLATLSAVFDGWRSFLAPLWVDYCAETNG